MKIRDLRIDDSWKVLNGEKTIYEGYNMENVPENILSLEIVKMFACSDTLYIETRDPEKELNNTQNKKRMFYDAETEWIYTEDFFREMYEEYKDGEENPCTFEQFIKDTIDFNGGIVEM